MVFSGTAACRVSFHCSALDGEFRCRCRCLIVNAIPLHPSRAKRWSYNPALLMPFSASRDIQETRRGQAGIHCTTPPACLFAISPPKLTKLWNKGYSEQGKYFRRTSCYIWNDRDRARKRTPLPLWCRFEEEMALYQSAPVSSIRFVCSAPYAIGWFGSLS